MERTDIFDHSTIANTLRNDSDFEYFSMDSAFPMSRDNDVRRAQGSKGFSYVSEFPKHGHLAFWNKKTNTMKAAVFFSLLCEGPPSFAHGGSILASFDHLYGMAVMRIGKFGSVTLSLTCDYKKSIPLGSIVLAIIEIEKVDGKKTFVTGRMEDENGNLFVTSKALFYQKNLSLTMDFETAAKIAQSRTKEETLEALRSHL